MSLYATLSVLEPSWNPSRQIDLQTSSLFPIDFWISFMTSCVIKKDFFLHKFRVGKGLQISLSKWMTFLGTAVLFQFRIIDHKNKLGVLICSEHFAVEGPSIHHCFAKPFDEFKCIRYFGEKNAKYKLSICKLSQTFLGFWYQWYLV